MNINGEERESRVQAERTVYIPKKGDETEVSSPFLLSLLSDSNQRPRDYKSRALAN